MAAPSTTSWSSVQNSYYKLGINVSLSTADAKTTVTIDVWLWTKYTLTDNRNTYYFDNNATSATTVIATNKELSHTSSSSWSESNQTKLGSHTYEYQCTSVDQTVYCAAKLGPIGGGESTITHKTSYVIPAVQSYTITYDANGGTGAPATQTKVHGTAITISSTKPTRSGYAFAGWGESTSAATASYESGATYSANASITLYAIWVAGTYTVSYDANGGTGAPSAQTKIYGRDLTLSSDVPTRTNYSFGGWGVSASSTTPAYSAGDTYSNEASVTLYAIWTSAYSRPIISVSGLSRVVDSETVDEYNRPIYTPDDLGTMMLMDISYEVSTFANPVSLKIEWKPLSESWSNEDVVKIHEIDISSVDSYGYASTFRPVLGGTDEENAISADSTYLIRVTVTDSIDNSSITLTLPGIAYSLDFLAGGKGAAFGKPAAYPDMLEINWTTQINDDLNATNVYAYQSVTGSDAEFGELTVNGPLTAISATITELYDGDGNAYVKGPADVISDTFTGSKSIDTSGNKNEIVSWTVTEDGVYAISANAVWASNSTGYRMLQILIYNGDTQVGKSVAYSKQFIAGNSGIAQNISGFRRVAKGHKIVLYAAQNSGGALDVSTYIMDIYRISR